MRSRAEREGVTPESALSCFYSPLGVTGEGLSARREWTGETKNE